MARIAASVTQGSASTISRHSWSRAGTAPVTPTSVVGLGDVLRGVPVGELVLVSQRQLRVHHEERDRRRPALARAREETERVRDREGELDSGKIRVISQRDVRGPFDDACLGRRRQAVRVALDDRDLARERDREEPLCVRGRVEGVRVVRKQARRREASRVLQARKEHPGADGRGGPAGQDHPAQTDDRPRERASAVRLMRSGRVLCEDEVTGRARRRRKGEGRNERDGEPEDDAQVAVLSLLTRPLACALCAVSSTSAAMSSSVSAAPSRFSSISRPTNGSDSMTCNALWISRRLSLVPLRPSPVWSSASPP